jgi:enterobacterial common antigen flippase
MPKLLRRRRIRCNVIGRRSNVLGALVGSLVVVLVYFTLGQTGIVPAIIATALASLGGSYWFARRIAVAPLTVNWHETWCGFRRLVGLGVAFMWGTLLLAALDIFTRSLITRKLGIEAAGIYQSAWALSGLFAYFVLLAMGYDFYPRLTATIHDHEKAARAVNEQTEIGILLALPGLLAVLAFAPLAIKLLYTQQFLVGFSVEVGSHPPALFASRNSFMRASPNDRQRSSAHNR